MIAFISRLTALTLFLGCSVAAAPAQNSAFFPSRPAHARTHTATGVLMQYGIGNKEGHIVLRDARGKTLDFYAGYPMHINGKLVQCAFPPQCRDWPATLVVGKTNVTVRYWSVAHEGRPANVTNALTYGR